MAFLTAENGASAGRRHELSQGRYVLGRHPECDIVVDAGAVSRHHAQLFRLGDQYFVEDMHSRNGTFVNDQLIFGRHQLRPGDRIRVCDIAFRFQQSESDTESSRLNQAVLVDDADDTRASTIMSKLDLSVDDSGSVRYSATPEAKLKALLEITKSLGRSLSQDQVLPQVLNSLFNVFLQADRGFVVLFDEKQDLVLCSTKLRRDEEGAAAIRISRTIINEVVRSKQAILSADAAADERFEMSESVADFRIRSMICAPLINVDGEVLGAIQIDTIDQRNRFRQEDLEVLGSVAIQAAIAIDNAQMHEKVLRQRELARDLGLAREVQESFLPDHAPSFTGYSFYDFYQPANHIGGDYYDYVPLPDGRLGILLADVVGHGIPAALLMSKLSAAARFSLVSEATADKAVNHLNRSLTPETFDGRFITLILIILDPARHEITLVNAGHMPPLLRQVNGTVTSIGESESGLPLMVDAGVKYRQHVRLLEPGESVLLYTDGITEAMNVEGELYGSERLLKCIEQNGSQPRELGERLIAEVQRFVSNRPAKDDRCIVCFGRSA